MKRLGILGGTFNPPHNGHLYIAQQAMLSAMLDRVLFVPCGNPPHKTVLGDVSAKDRLNMTALAIKDKAGFELCDIEVKSAEKSYTANTLKKLKKIYPGCELCFIVGADSLDYLDLWYHPEEIFKLAEIIAVSRKGLNPARLRERSAFYEEKYGAKITIVEAVPLDVSSSEVRDRIKGGNDVSQFIGEEVLNYIKLNGIYKET